MGWSLLKMSAREFKVADERSTKCQLKSQNKTLVRSPASFFDQPAVCLSQKNIAKTNRETWCALHTKLRLRVALSIVSPTVILSGQTDSDNVRVVEEEEPCN
jgi:hypothetical protein